LVILLFNIDVRLITVLILIAIGAIAVCGVQESSFVTMVMFCLHIFSLTLLIIWGFAYGIHDDFNLFEKNMQTDVPAVYSSSGTLLANRNIAAAIYFGYSSGLLGITGFETASNYVEEMESSQTFISTVNWMW
jgi:amino acid transporter